MGNLLNVIRSMYGWMKSMVKVSNTHRNEFSCMLGYSLICFWVVRIFFILITVIIHIDNNGAEANVDITSALKDDTDRHSEHNLLIKLWQLKCECFNFATHVKRVYIVIWINCTFLCISCAYKFPFSLPCLTLYQKYF